MQPEFDSDGYPTDNTLKVIEEWNWRDPVGLLDYVVEAWHYVEYRTKEESIDKYSHKPILIYTLCTGGWSGNESLISALMDNKFFWDFNWYSSTVGGKYVFKVKI